MQVGPYIHEFNQDYGIICQDIRVRDDNTLNTTTTNSIMFSVTSMNTTIAGVHSDFSTGVINIIDNDGNGPYHTNCFNHAVNLSHLSSG